MAQYVYTNIVDTKLLFVFSLFIIVDITVQQSTLTICTVTTITSVRSAQQFYVKTFLEHFCVIRVLLVDIDDSLIKILLKMECKTKSRNLVLTDIVMDTKVNVFITNTVPTNTYQRSSVLITLSIMVELRVFRKITHPGLSPVYEDV